MTISNGQIFGDWTVLRRLPVTGKNSKYRCKCICGREQDVYGNNLKRGLSQRCKSCRYARLSSVNAEHGLSNTSEHRIWRGMIQRCTNPKVSHYPLYGGRGITVCERWMSSFESFYTDMGPRPSSRHSIDRIDPDGSYTPKNCRWATHKEQSNNKRGSKICRVDGEECTLSEALVLFGIPKATYHSRARKGTPKSIAMTVGSLR